MAKSEIDYGSEVQNFVDYFNLLACRKDQTIYRYMESKGIFIPLDSVEINRLIDIYIRQAGTDLPWMDYSFNVLSKHISTVSEYVDEMGAPAGTIVFSNGTYKAGKGKLFKHSAKNLAISALPCSYDVKAKADRFDSFIKSVADGDTAMELTLLEMLGAVLTHSSNKIQRMGICFGNGSNGKSLYLRLCEVLCGKSLTANISLNDIASDKAFDRIAILNARLLCIHELEQGLSMNKLLGENVKRIITGEEISAERKFKEKVYFKPRGIILAASNYHPIIETPSPSLKRRLLMLEFRRNFLGSERNPNLFKEILGELPGVVNRALEGYERLKSQNFVFSSQADSDRLYEAMVVETNPMYAFVKECVVSCPEGKVKNDTLLRAYKEWAQDNNIHVVGDSNSLSKQLTTALQNADIPFSYDKSNGLRVKKGIRLTKGGSNHE